MRLLLVGAFPYPLSQGSQVYFQEQAIALREAGAQVELLTYASGDPDFEGADRALDGFPHRTPPPWTAPRRMRSGPGLGKPLADLALAHSLNDAVASFVDRSCFDAVMTHHAEAGLAGLLGGRSSGVPLIYCVHTLLEKELSAYLNADSAIFRWGPPGKMTRRLVARGLDDTGRRIDRFLARRMDGWIALTQSSGRVMRQHSTRPGALIPPPVPTLRGGRNDPEVTTCADRHGLEAGEYFLYSGNLDGYQEIPLLEQAAVRLRERRRERGTASAGGPGPRAAPRIVVASHDASGAERIAAAPGLSFRHVPSPHEMLLLLRGARANLVMRQAEGGYPIKLANAHAAGTPSIVFREREWGLTDGVDCLAASPDRPAETLAKAIDRLAQDAGLAERLGAGARALHRAQHAPEIVAERTLKLVEQVIARAGA